MITDDEKPTEGELLSAAQEGQIRRNFLLWLAEHLSAPKYDTLLPIARADIRRAVADELKLLAEGM